VGFDISAGAAVICARATDGLGELPADTPALLAELGDGRVYGLASSDATHAIAAALSQHGLTDIAFSPPCCDPAALHEALREAELLSELGPAADGNDQTYRLLVGVLLRDAGELERLRSQTISALQSYDSDHDTDLVHTLREFLTHDGSTTDTAEHMQLHRHTVGYRLARVYAVSGLSPYQTEGRERLSLGLKADQLLHANERLVNHG
jgi:sugar diacid utilization regulator